MTRVVRRKRRVGKRPGVKRAGGKSVLEEEFLRLWGLLAEPGLPKPVRELKFDRNGVRKWRFDFAWPARGDEAPTQHGGVAVECHGGIFTGGRHARGVGLHADFSKQNTAIEQGWVVLAYSSAHIKKEPEEMIRQVCAVVRARLGQ